MSREELLLERAREWLASGQIREPRPWLERHGLVALLPELYGESEARRWIRRNLSENLLLCQRGEDAVRALRDAEIGVAFLKGIDLLDRLYHGREACRPTADVDILVDHRKLDEALTVVEALGYRCVGTESKEVQVRWSPHVEYEGPQEVRIEVHKELLLDTGFDVTWEELQRLGMIEEGAGPGGGDRLTLDALVVHLLVHMAKHRFGGDSLRWVLDVLLLLDRYEKALNGERLVEVARRLRGRRAAGASVLALGRLLPRVDLGPLRALPSRSLRQRLALRLVDPEQVVLLGEKGWTQRRSVLSRMLLDSSFGATLSFVVRKRRLRRARGF